MEYKEIDNNWLGNITISGEPLTTESITIGDSMATNSLGGYSISNGGLGSSVVGSVISGAVGSNTIWTTTGTGTSPYILSTPSSIDSSGKLTLQGNNADIDINGKSLKNWMEKVEERLNIVTPNPELEKEWEELRRLGERYRKLEKKCKEKAEVWNKLKSMPKPEVKW